MEKTIDSDFSTTAMFTTAVEDSASSFYYSMTDELDSTLREISISDDTLESVNINENEFIQQILKSEENVNKKSRLNALKLNNAMISKVSTPTSKIEKRKEATPPLVVEKENKENINVIKEIDNHIKSESPSVIIDSVPSRRISFCSPSKKAVSTKPNVLLPISEHSQSNENCLNKVLSRKSILRPTTANPHIKISPKTENKANENGTNQKSLLPLGKRTNFKTDIIQSPRVQAKTIRKSPASSIKPQLPSTSLSKRKSFLPLKSNITTEIPKFDDASSNSKSKLHPGRKTLQRYSIRKSVAPKSTSEILTSTRCKSPQPNNLPTINAVPNCIKSRKSLYPLSMSRKSITSKSTTQIPTKCNSPQPNLLSVNAVSNAIKSRKSIHPVRMPRKSLAPPQTSGDAVKSTRLVIDNLTCEYCDKSFSLRNALHNHRLQHCEKIPGLVRKRLLSVEFDLANSSTKSGRSNLSEDSSSSVSSESGQMKPPSLKHYRPPVRSGVRMTPKKEIMCRFCEKRFYTIFLLQDHEKNRKCRASNDNLAAKDKI